MTDVTLTGMRDRLISQRIVPVLRLANAEITERAADCLLDAGFSGTEITLTIRVAVDLLDRQALAAGDRARAVFHACCFLPGGSTSIV